MATVPGLERALKDYSSLTKRERTRAAVSLREIFGNPDNVDLFQRTALQSGGTAWVALFQVFFSVVLLERREVAKKPGATAEKRLADAVSLVRWSAERFVHLFTKKPFMTLVTHMTTLLVTDGRIYEVVAIDYSKALRTLLSFPPHLEHMDEIAWRTLLGVCLGGVLGDRVTVDEDWEGEEGFSDAEDDGHGSRHNALSANVSNELLSLIPILLSSSRAPLVAPPINVDNAHITHPSLGLTVLLKINRYLRQLPPQAVIPLEILRSLNIVLAELELNCKESLTDVCLKLFPPLVAIFTSRSRGDLSVRENALIALRIMLPFVSHTSVVKDESIAIVHASMGEVVDWMPKETGSRGAVRPIDLKTLRFNSSSTHTPFQLAGVMAGFGFDASQAINWAAVELYADCTFHTYDSASAPSSSTYTTQKRKRQRTENGLEKLLFSMSGGSLPTRQLACQVAVFLIGTHWSELHDEARDSIRRKLLDQLDDEDNTVQSWSFIGLSCLASCVDDIKENTPLRNLPATPSARASRQSNDLTAWERLWNHAVRKASVTGVSRAACFAASVVLKSGKVDSARTIQDVHALLKSVDIQGLGPSSVTDASCAFLVACLHATRADSGLYSADLEDKVLDWFGRAFNDGSSKKSKMSSVTPANKLALLRAICNFQGPGIEDVSVAEQLPDSPVVVRMLYEAETRPIRRAVLYAQYPDLPADAVPPAAGTTDLSPESLNMLEGRPRKLSNMLRAALEDAAEDWEQDDKSKLVIPERVRKGVDLVVLALAFQATVQANGLRPDAAGCVQSAATLLDLLIPSLSKLSDNVNALHLVWRGFMPLYHSPCTRPAMWPIILKPDASSGIRRDILPPNHYASHAEDDHRPGDNPRDKLLSLIWTGEEMAEALNNLVEASKTALENLRSSARGLSNGSMPLRVDDDDFEPILNADADVVAQSLEAKEAHRATSSLMKTLVDIRLRGPLLASAGFRPTRDIPLLNTFLEAEGSHFDQLGFVLCDAFQDKSLRFTLEAVDLILTQLWERLTSYLYKRDGKLLQLTILFLARSLAMWLSPDSGLTDRALELARSLTSIAVTGKMAYWPARLQLLAFVDEYLDYDPVYSIWSQYEMEEADQKWGPLRFVLDATGDLDARVRFRAISSAASVHYLVDVSPDLKQEAYYFVLDQQRTITYNLDHWLTNMLWKLNTCVASARLRSGTLFHLYEMAAFSVELLPYLQPGLEAVAKRLGLDALQPLFTAHATVIIENQLKNDQMPLSLPPALYGCASRKEFARLCLESVGSRLLAVPDVPYAMPFFAALCEAASIAEEQARARHLPFAAAIAATSAFLDNENDPSAAQKAASAVESLPSPRPNTDLKLFFTSRTEVMTVNLIGLTDLCATNEEVATMLNGDKSKDKSRAGDTFLRLMENDVVVLDAPPVLEPAATDHVISDTLKLFAEMFPKMSKRRMVFDGLVRLFFAVNDTYLVNEQRRYLRAIAILVSLYSADIAWAQSLEQFICNVVDLLPKDDIGGVAMNMLEWGFDQVPKCHRDHIPNLTDVLINLGSVYARLMSSPHLLPVAERLDSWVASKAQTWTRTPGMEAALDAALVFWPPAWTSHFPRGLEFNFESVAIIAERSKVQNPMALSRRLATTMNANDTSQRDTFLSSTFWYLKKTLAASQWDGDGAKAFLDLLYKTHGEVHAPSFHTIRDLAGQSVLEHLDAGEKKKLSRLPEVSLRLEVFGNLLEKTTADDFRLRATTFEVLQSTLPIMKTMAADPALKNITKKLGELVTFLVANTAVTPGQEHNIDVLVDEGSGWVYKARNHQQWAKELALLLGGLASMSDPFYGCLHPLLSAKGHMAIELLPFLVQAVLTIHLPEERATEHRADVLANYFSQVLQYPGTATETIETIIRIVLHLRHYRPPYRTGESSYNHWLQIDPLVLSEAAGKCGAYASSLLFLEMAGDRDDQSPEDLDLSTLRVQKIMYDIYSNVEDPDGFYGIQNSDVMDSLLRRLDHEARPLQSLGYNLAGFESATSSMQPLVSSLRNLHDLGFHSFAGSFMKSRRQEKTADTRSDPLFLELAWRMGDWEVPVTPDVAETSPGRFYAALRAVHRERDAEVARRLVDETIRQEMSHLRKIGVERMTEIKSATVNLLCLRDIARWVSVPMQAAVHQSDFEGATLSSFVNLSPSFDFANAERLSATRLSLIRSARARESKHLLGDLVSNQSEGLANLEVVCQLRLSELARKEGNLQAAVNAVTAIRQLEAGSPSDAAQDEFSQVLWAQGHHSLAIQHITAITKSLNPKKDGQRLAILLGRSAHWTALAKLKAPEDIRLAFYTAIRQVKQFQASSREQARVVYDFAVWTDGYHSSLKRSPELERLSGFAKRKDFQKVEATLRSLPPGSPRQTGFDEDLEEEVQSKIRLEESVHTHLEGALKSYATALHLCDDYDDCVTRLCSLWLENDNNDKALKAFTPDLKSISPHKFIVLAPQLAARLHKPEKQTRFNSLLNNLMAQMAEEHPYHVLYQIITLAAGTLPKDRRGTPRPILDARSQAAQDILDRLQANVTGKYGLAQQASVAMTHFARASVEWAQQCHDVKDTVRPGKSMDMPPSCPLKKCRGLNIPVATVVPAIDLSLQYANIPTIDRYLDKYKVAGGIHKPAIMSVLDTLGQEHVQLFKAEDEVRQDAVMEQVFDMTNRLLSRDRKTNLRNLTFRTYTVVPLAFKTGIIEFVGHTTAIGDWLKEAHTRYRKGTDLSADVVRKGLHSLQNADHTSPKLKATFENYLERFKPVMRHFFTEKRKEPLAWFSMRLNYARSVAVTSIVGHMVGLGDRHCSNILIDKNSGELIHIDFGIVFEEGQKLRIPEKVPFRLTNDIVDGLGITGVNGTFRQCAEHTLRVLRDSSDLILTVLEVFKHDPLYAWSPDSGKVKRAQGGGRVETVQSTGQEKAERVLSRIREKLGKELSVEYTVNMLIQEARNPENLAKIYVGWQPWL